MSRTKTLTVQGAGIGFLFSAIFFVFTWHLAAFLLAPLGATIGYFLSRSGSLGQGVQWNGSESSAGRAAAALVERLGHPHLGVRFLSLWLLGFGLFLGAWILAYFLLPEGAFRTATAAQLESRGLGETAGSVAGEWWGILRNNLIPLVLIVAANLVIRVQGVPLGYVVPVYNLILYGLVLGTNSFAFPYPERWAPTFAILGRAGPYEMTAFVLAAAATGTWSFYQVQQLFRTNPERTKPRIQWGHWAALLLAGLLIAGAAWVEANMIVARG